LERLSGALPVVRPDRALGIALNIQFSFLAHHMALGLELLNFFLPLDIGIFVCVETEAT
jgi:hypothetical protein